MRKRPRLTELGWQKRQARPGIFQALALSTAPFLDYKKSNFLSPPSAPPPLLGVAVLNASPTLGGCTDPPARSALRAPPIGARREEGKNLPKRRGWGKKQVRAREPNFSAAETREHNGPKPAAPEPPTPPPSVRRCRDSAGGGGGGPEAGRGRQTLPTRFGAQNSRGSRRPERGARGHRGRGSPA